MGTRSWCRPWPTINRWSVMIVDRCRGLARGLRGTPPLDRLALHDLILRFARLLTDTPELVEADLNSVRVLPAGCLVLDARLRLTAPPLPARTRTW